MGDRALIVQPIHADGWAVLRRAGLEPVAATSPHMSVVAAEIGDACAVITRSAGLDRRAIEAAPRLRVIGNHGTGVDPIDVALASRLGIPVVFTPEANTVSVAEQTVALLLAVTKRVLDADRAARAGDFDFKYRAELRELAGATLGVVGVGRIAQRVAHLLGVGFGMRVLGYARRTAPVAGIERAESLEALLAASDVVSLHVPATPETVGLIGARELALMRPGAILLNTARGALLDEAALAEALAAGRLGGAGLDVFAREPLPPDHPLAASPRVVLSPHVAGSTLEAARRTAVDVAEQVVAALRGERPRHLVDPAVWGVRRRG